MRVETRAGLIFDSNDKRCHLIKRGQYPYKLYFIRCYDQSTEIIKHYYGLAPTAKTEEEEAIECVMSYGDKTHLLYEELSYQLER